MIPVQSLLPAGYKWARFFRLQMAVTQTAKNRARAQKGLKQVGRPRPRLVSLDTTDLLAVPASWSVEDAASHVASQRLPYFALFMDGDYHSLAIDNRLVQFCLDDGRLTVLPEEGLYKW